jgi:hypothetical protein
MMRVPATRNERKVGFTMANFSGTAPLPRALGATPSDALAKRANVAPGLDMVRFELQPNPQFLKCLARYPDDPTRRPSVRAAIVRGSLDDELFLVGKNIKPNLRLELLTVQHTQLRGDGTVDPGFVHFGLAWYQSDLEADDNGVLGLHIRAVLLDQFFGFDAAVSLAPTGTFHVGLWFSDPADVAAAGFDVAKPTPFGKKNRGGPLAMISVPVATTGLGPLCTHPSIWVSLANCHS